ncbi:hypothetical protein ACQQ2N_02835 [Dokdonella sp. MW10]|uniref:hypothetical protein n=1 Tax=Dokdonella sp. MW10 TaxID=2992926 RepID=UPI003F81CD5C
MSEAAYRVDDGTPARDREAALAIWRGNLGEDARMPLKFDWFYTACPFGEPAMKLLRHASGDPVGIATAGPRRMLVDGRDVRAGVLVDLAVVPEHRALGPAMMLQASFLAAGDARFDLLYGFPNPRAAPVFKRSGYAKLGDIVRYARVLRHAGYLARKLPQGLAAVAGALVDVARRLGDAWRSFGNAPLLSSWSTQADPRFDALWAAAPATRGLAAVRDATFARWRFDESPLAQTRYLLLADPSGSTLRAWFACRDNGKVLQVVDFWSDDAAVGLGRPYIDALLRAARHGGYAAVSVEYAGPVEGTTGWTAAGFRERSRRPVFGHAFGATTLPATLHLTAADEDE